MIKVFTRKQLETIAAVLTIDMGLKVEWWQVDRVWSDEGMINFQVGEKRTMLSKQGFWAIASWAAV